MATNIFSTCRWQITELATVIIINLTNAYNLMSGILIKPKPPIQT